MRETRTSGSMSGERKRNDGKSKLPQVTAPLLDSTARDMLPPQSNEPALNPALASSRPFKIRELQGNAICPTATAHKHV
jgi:hypothetical protein